MLLTENKLDARIREVAGARYRDSILIPSFRCKEDTIKSINGGPPLDEEDWGVIHVGNNWTGRDAYLWLNTEVTIPAEWQGRTVLGRFDFGNTGGGNNSGFESLFYLNGEIYQGVDVNHQEVFLPEMETGTASFTFRLWSGLEGGGIPTPQEHKLAMAELSWLDEEVDAFYYLSLAAFETVRELGADRPERMLLLKALDQAYRRIDWSVLRCEAFYESLYEASRFLNEQVNRMEKTSPVTVRCIGHTHIDVAWLWRLKHTREKCARSFSTVMRLMEKYPDYVFLQTQPQLYAYVKEDFPDLYRQIKERAKEGRWEAGGGMWLEADCNLTSGESLVRQILLGTRFLREEFGTECRYLWLPDVFGYSWALPQILRKSGIHSFMTTKISWNQYNRMPHDTFKWRGIDGTEVLTHFITTPEPWNGPDSWFYTYNGRISAKTVKGIWDGYRDKENNQELLLSYGYGDGGGGVNRDMLEMRRQLDRMPGLPKLENGRADDYFDRLQERIASAEEYVHTWDGELYLEYHRGTYTSQAYNKRMNRKLELLYRETEWFGALAAQANGDWSLYPQQRMNDGWLILLRNQFHDIIPGSSIREVYEDSRLEYEEAEELAEEARSNFARLTIQPEGECGYPENHAGSAPDTCAYTLLNSASWVRNDLAYIPADPAADTEGAWIDAEGHPIPAQRTAEGGWLIKAPELPPMALSTIRFVPGEPVGARSQTEDRNEVQTGNGTEAPTGSQAEAQAGSQAEVQTGMSNRVEASPFAPQNSGIHTPYYEIEWDGNGQLTRLFDRKAGRNVLLKGHSGNVLQVFEDKPLAHEAWDIDLFYQEKSKEVRDLKSAAVTECGPLRATVSFEWSYGNSTIKQQLRLYANSRRIDFVTEADWQERQQLLKVAFPVEVRATEATYDIQFGNVKRPTHWNTSWDRARFESVGHQWADLSERGYGVSLLNDCKYGYDIKDSTMRLSLIKSATHPDPTADQGQHHFTYALLPHQGDWLEGNTAREAWELNQPLAGYIGTSALSGRSLLHISSPYVMVDAVKKTEDEDSLIVRLHDYAGIRGECVLTSDFGIASWQETDLLERPAGDLSMEPDCRISVAPYEIKTIKIRLSER